MAQLRSQLVAVVIESAFARTFNGKISPVTTHAIGPCCGLVLVGAVRIEGRRTYPGGSKEEDVDADESNAGSLASEVGRENSAVGWILARSSCTENCNEELADAHPDGTPEEKWSAAPLVDSIKTRDGRRDVDCGRNHRDNERVPYACVVKELGTYH